MRTSVNGIDLIKRHEGFRSKPYNCPAGHCTIGYGHLIHQGVCTDADFHKNPSLTESNAAELLVKDLVKFEEDVRNQVTVPLNQNQFDALVSFVFNLGPARLKQSTLLKKLNLGQYDAVPDEFRKWVHADGKVLDGLKKRRDEEAELFAKPQ